MAPAGRVIGRSRVRTSANASEGRRHALGRLALRMTSLGSRWTPSSSRPSPAPRVSGCNPGRSGSIAPGKSSTAGTATAGIAPRKTRARLPRRSTAVMSDFRPLALAQPRRGFFLFSATMPLNRISINLSYNLIFAFFGKSVLRNVLFYFSPAFSDLRFIGPGLVTARPRPLGWTVRRTINGLP